MRVVIVRDAPRKVATKAKPHVKATVRNIHNRRNEAMFLVFVDMVVIPNAEHWFHVLIKLV